MRPTPGSVNDRSCPDHQAGLFQTDQIQCYDIKGQVIPCSGTGQDGDTRKGMLWPEPRFFLNHDSSSQNNEPGKNRGLPQNRFVLSEDMVEDRATGLSWLKHADILEKAVTWPNALVGIKQINHEKKAGYNDWRLPNIRELESLVDISTHSPAIAGKNHFKSVRPFYWSSTTSCYEPAYAWTLYTEDGNIGVGYKQHPEFHVWPVRSGQYIPIKEK